MFLALPYLVLTVLLLINYATVLKLPVPIFICIGSIVGLKTLLNYCQVAVISRLPQRRYEIFLDYLRLNKIFFDGVYMDKRKDQRPFQDYSQILRDFGISSDRILSQVLVIAIYNRIDCECH